MRTHPGTAVAGPARAIGTSARRGLLMRDYDVVIAGGGPAGAAAAIALARAGRRVCLVDSDNERTEKCGDGLPPAATGMLRDLGVLERVLHGSLRPQPAVAGIDWGDAQARQHLLGLHGQDLHIDRARFDLVLRDAAASAGAMLYRQTRISLPLDTARTEDDWLALRMRSGPGTERGIRCRWLIDAGGRSAVLARRLGAQRLHDDRQSALWLRLAHAGQGPLENALGGPVIEAVEDGWWYSVPIGDTERVAAFLCDDDHPDMQRLCEREGLWTQLTRAPRLHALCKARGYVPLGPPLRVESGSSCLDRVAGTRWLAVGDAAIGLDPLGAKGVASALYTGLRAANALDCAMRGQPQAVDDYAAHLQQVYVSYRRQLLPIYLAEQRWPQATFWQRRHTRFDTAEIPIRSRADAEPGADTPQDA